MTNKKTTKRALTMSVVSLFLCFTMLLGTTYAWFTDSVISSGNKIQAGTLDIQLFMYTDVDQRVEITDESAPIFGSDESILAQNNVADTLWEPGKTQVVYFAIKNNGSLALKYTVDLFVTAVTKNLNEALVYTIVPDAQYGEIDARSSINWDTAKQVGLGNNMQTDEPVPLYPDDATTPEVEGEHYFALAVHMLEEADNKYQNGSITFDLTVYASQLAYEEDSFGKDYDAEAEYPYVAQKMLDVKESATRIQIKSVASVEFPRVAAADETAPVTLTVAETTVSPNITVTDGYEVKAFDVSVTNVKEGNTEDIYVNLYIGKGFDPQTFKLYHYDDEITCSYDPIEGYVRFTTTSFSPFTVVYDADSEYVVPENQAPEDLPKADLVRREDLENVDHPWGSYGQWSPTEGLDSQLEAAYIFSSIDTAEEAAANPYAAWICDFVVSLDRDLGENQIFLGGNYGSFAWVGFHNGTIMPKANEEVALLTGVGAKFTYLDIVTTVEEFICGVGDVDDALAGATFTVKLRLTNPENSAEYWDVATVTHTFTGAAE